MDGVVASTCGNATGGMWDSVYMVASPRSILSIDEYMSICAYGFTPHIAGFAAVCEIADDWRV